MKFEELGKNTDTNIKILCDLLHKYDYETIKTHFDSVYITRDSKRFDFELGLLCGTIENGSDNRPMLTDLQFTQRHLI